MIYYMKKANFLLMCLMIGGAVMMQAQSDPFKASGKPFIKVFTNYHSTFTGDEIHNQFEIQRAYFGYGVNFSEDFSGNVTLDVGSSGAGSLDYTAYLKNAYFQYKHDKLSVKFGLIGLSQFSLQEKQWGARYILKSFQDQYKYGSSADFGVLASYKLHNMISLDASVLNGEGYKSLEVDSILKYTVGLTLEPVKGLDLRAYYDRMGNDNAQQSLSFFAGYTHGNVKLGAEYNMQLNNKIKADHDLTGLSFYASYKMKKMRLFGRFDQLASTTLSGESDPWNYSKDGQLVVAGVEFVPVKGITLSPNYQLWTPADGSSSVNGAYLNCEIKF